ncbi:MAG: hypothetical protein AB7S78_11180 [Candidatus Omnitrophota bacterium]
MHRIKIQHKLAAVLIVSILGACVISDAAEESAEYKYNDNGRRDPFWKLISSSGTINNYEADLMVSDLSLQGIMSGAAGNIAMINGKIVKVDDKIGQFIITEITDDWVLLQKDQQVFKLKLKKEE